MYLLYHFGPTHPSSAIRSVLDFSALRLCKLTTQLKILDLSAARHLLAGFSVEGSEAEGGTSETRRARP
jgi:hypothetical protein